MKRKYLIRLFIGFDQFINTLFNGDPDETISARAYRLGEIEQQQFWMIMRKIINGIFFWQKNHCYRAYLSEFDRNQLSPHYRSKP